MGVLKKLHIFFTKRCARTFQEKSAKFSAFRLFSGNSGRKSPPGGGFHPTPPGKEVMRNLKKKDRQNEKL